MLIYFFLISAVIDHTSSMQSALDEVSFLPFAGAQCISWYWNCEVDGS